MMHDEVTACTTNWMKLNMTSCSYSYKFYLYHLKAHFSVFIDLENKITGSCTSVSSHERIKSFHLNIISREFITFMHLSNDDETSLSFPLTRQWDSSFTITRKVCFAALGISYVWTFSCLPLLNQYLSVDKVFWWRTHNHKGRVYIRQRLPIPCIAIDVHSNNAFTYML